MKTSIATVSISGDLGQKLAAIAAAGFDGVEIFENDFLAFDASPCEIGRMVVDHGLSITLFQPFRDFETLPEPQRSRAFERAERKFDVMQELGADLILICSSVSPLALGGIDRAADDLRALGERAAQRGLRIGYEALAWGRHVSDHRDAWEIVRRVDHPHVGLILDSFHTLARQTPLETIRSIPKDKIFIVQLADAPLFQMDLLSWSRHYRCMPGQGDLPVADFMEAVCATGYDGTISLEVFNDEFRAGSPRAVAVDGHRSLTALVDAVARRAPALGINAPAMPPPVRADGISFVEFAVDGAEAERLGALLGQMGFALRGRHRSKAVTLFSCGQANIVLNEEKEGFSHSAHLLHGASVCALGIEVADAAATEARAVRLGAEPFERQKGVGDLDMPAVRGVGGLLYFTDRTSALSHIWEVEFELEPPRPTTAGDVERVDHVSQTMHQGEMLTSLLFYTSILDVRKTSEVDVSDPAGLVKSRVVENQAGTLRITMNGVQNRRTQAGRFIAETFGSSVQHVAFATSEIFAAASRMTEAGVPILPVSENYYGDLDARFDIEPDVLKRMRALHILYDREPNGGEFFQFYTEALEDGFFFEIIERRNGYRGYGASNAAIRIAAQKRHARPIGLPRI
ncbi:bifunctional sugar phosphate isomerase/epimerase/4-hydroxyphenylpyruvate dioxygenase family protein [Aurantimonas sp. HBX-1]|uniref:bifunctional sugar phosphate isomerase/epimerase/4-hydroxyphenylpyruvate dioxygenase family protein n=1 Tax=Aurantimonas sp. HBX-1 TaxID=2906072 RepID=UPI001F4805C8|nr:sugar phosphate isomerase/epimerase and 4-hydroxyphenylpyruvate domain-containing protein [Aurantimonas sp. HBX-1]UIJ72655.1 sugar phosphate isomerase/epimerase and 4-hydroxyphenylpyruvate domain-containing protein [Aurantimonas sp. HBX-1]